MILVWRIMRDQEASSICLLSTMLREETRIDERLGDAHRLGVGERVVQPIQRIRPSADALPRHVGGVALEKAQAPAGNAPARCPSSRGSRGACD